MKNICAILLFILPFLCFGQCPSIEGSGYITTLSSQAEINDFGLNYPNCSEYNTRLIISGSDIVDLTPLAGLTEINSLQIINNPLLINLNGLNLTHIPGNSNYFIQIEDNLVLQDISALSSIVQTGSINGSGIIIQNNPQLISLNGLQGIDANYVERIIINNNDSLTNLSGMQGVTGTDYLTISNNDSLVNFSGFENFVQVYAYIIIENNSSLVSFLGIENLTGNLSEMIIRNNLVLSDISQLSTQLDNVLRITNNPNLSICNITAICNYFNDPNFYFDFANYFDISNNAEGCDSYFQVAYACGSVPVNDECERAISMEITQSIEAYNFYSTQSPQAPSCNDSENRVDVWFTFNSADSLIFDILVEGGSYNLQLWEGDCTNLIQVSNACGSNILELVEVNANTDYYLQVWSDISNNRGSALFDITVYGTTLSIDDVIENNFSIFPNPVKNTLEFESDNTISSIAIYNLLGQNVMSAFPNASEEKIDLSSLSSGMYIVKVNINNTFQSYRVIKE